MLLKWLRNIYLLISYLRVMITNPVNGIKFISVYQCIISCYSIREDHSAWGCRRRLYRIVLLSS